MNTVESQGKTSRVPDTPQNACAPMLAMPALMLRGLRGVGGAMAWIAAEGTMLQNVSFRRYSDHKD
jgi:hypothetical protein